MLWIIIVLLSFVAGSDAFAEPRQWERDGFPVRAVRVIDDYSSVSRADGTTLIVWAQSEGREPIVKGQLVSPSGAPLWAEGGIVLAQGEEKSSFPVVVSAEGGWIVVWLEGIIIYTGREERSDFGATGELRAIKIDDNGAPVWTGGRAGIVVSPTLDWGIAKSYTIHPSGGGAIVTWHTWEEDRAQRITADGELAWTTAVDVPYYQIENLNIVSDGAGGILFVWSTVNGTLRELRANKLLPDGTFAWNSEVGALVHSSNSDHRAPTICMDGNGGAFVEWMFTEPEPTLIAQHLNAQGEVQWQAAGVTVLELENSWWLRRMAPSYTAEVVDGYLSITAEAPENAYNLIGQKVTTAGVPVWGLDGTLICDALTDSLEPADCRIASDLAGGLVCNVAYSILGDWYNRLVGVFRIAADESRPWNEECLQIADTAIASGTILNPPSIFGDIVRCAWLKRSTIADNDVHMQDFDLATGVPAADEPLSLSRGDNHFPEFVQITKLNNGSTAIAWSTQGGWNETSYFQIVDVFGNPLLEEGGRVLCRQEDGTPLPATRPQLCPDGNGGFFAVMRSYTTGTYIMRAVHVDGNGNFVSSPEGVLFTFDDYFEIDYNGVFCCPDGTGGCYVASSWFNSEFLLEILVVRLDAQCQLVWDAPTVIENVSTDLRAGLLTPSDDNSALISYRLMQFNDNEVRIARVSHTGEILWDHRLAWHLRVSEYSTIGGSCPDHHGGAFATWINRDEEEVYRAWVQHITPDGEFLLGNEGLLIFEGEQYIRDLSCSADIVGNVTVAWEQHDESDLNIHAQRVRADGTIAWQENGIALTTATRDQYDPQTIAISDNEVYVVWQDDRAAGQNWWDTDIYGTHLNARGRIGDDSYWQEGGSPICNYGYFQSNAAVVADGMGGITVAWLDARCGFGYDFSVFAQRLYDPIFTEADETPVVPVEFSLAQNYPNPFNPETVIEFSIPVAGKTSLKVFDITGRLVTTLLDEPISAGVHRAHFDGSKLASGVYFYKLEAAEKSFTRKMVLVK